MQEAIRMTLPTAPAFPRDTDWSASFRTLYDAEAASVSRFLMRLGVRPAQVEDARQEVFLEAFRYLPSFRGECSPKTWLYKLCVSQARRFRRREAMRNVVLSCLGQKGSFVESTRGELTHEQSIRLVEGALRVLSQSEREVFVLFEFEGLLGTEIGKVLNIPEASVWRRLHYARERFRSHIEAREGT
jgi:RNA polymerase sigma-70 factor, ECF subfamily